MNKIKNFLPITIFLWIILGTIIWFSPINYEKLAKPRTKATKKMLEAQGQQGEQLETTIALIKVDEESKARSLRREQFTSLLTYILVSITAMYVVITWKVLKTSKEYNKISIRPLIGLGLHKALNNSSLLTIKNIGLGPAKNLRVWVNGEKKEEFFPKEDKDGIIGKRHRIGSLAKEDSFILSLRGRWVEGEKFRVRVEFSSMFDENFCHEEVIEIPNRKA